MLNVELKEVIDLFNGFAFKSDDYIEFSNVLNCRMSNIRPDGSFNILYNSRYLPDDYIEKYSNYLLNDGDLILAMTDLAGDPKILGVPTLVNTEGKHILLNQRVGKLILMRPDLIYLPWLRYNLSRKEVQKYYSKFSNGGLQINLGKSDLLSYKINIPSLAIQKAIAEKLDKADALRKKDQELLKQYDDLVQAIFIDMFGDPVQNEKGWEVVTGDYCCENISVGVVIKPASYYVDKGILALRSLNVKQNYFDLSNIVFFSEEAHNTVLAKSKLKTNDVVVIRTGLTGTASIITEELNGCNCIDLIILRLNFNLINSHFITYFLNSDSGKMLTIGKQVGGIQKHFNVGAMKGLQLPLPPISLQNQFAEKIKNIEAQKALVKQQAEESENLFQALLQESFTFN